MAKRARKKRENKRRGNQRRRDATRKAASTLSAGVAIAAGTQSYAEAIRFDNPPGPCHFEWAREIDPFLSAGVLDVALGPVAQDIQDPYPYAELPTEFQHSAYMGFFGDSSRIRGAGYGYSATSGIEAVDVLPCGQYYGNAYDMASPANALGIPDPTATLVFDDSVNVIQPYGGYCSPLIPEGVPSYLGIRFDLGGGTQYGWIGVTRTGLELDAFAWGYETTPGVPIVPGAGTIQPGPDPTDCDGDGINNDVDNCPLIQNANQDDLDGDGEGDACDADRDGDGEKNNRDICPDNEPGLNVFNTPNSGQFNGVNGRPIADLNNDCEVNGLDIQVMVNELLGP